MFKEDWHCLEKVRGKLFSGQNYCQTATQGAIAAAIQRF